MFSPNLVVANRIRYGRITMRRTLAGVWREVKIDIWACAKSWRTTSVGLLLIVVGLFRFFGMDVDHITTPPETLIIAGLGLVFAKDARIQF